MCVCDLALNNLQKLICHKIQPTKQQMDKSVSVFICIFIITPIYIYIYIYIYMHMNFGASVTRSKITEKSTLLLRMTK